MSDDLTKLAESFIHGRLGLGWTQERLAKDAGVPVDAIVEYETNPALLQWETAMEVLDALVDGMTQPGNSQPFLLPPLDQVDLPDMPLDVSKMPELEAALRIDQRRFAEALLCLEEAVRLSPSPKRTGTILLSRIAVLAELCHEERAFEALRAAEHCLSAEHKTTLWLRFRLEQMDLLCQTERYAEAAAYRQETHDLAQAVGYDKDRLRLRCLNARIAYRLEEEGAAELLAAARDETKAAGGWIESTALTLDLATLLETSGKHAEARKLERRLASPTLHKKLSRTACTRLKIFCGAIPRRKLTVEMGRQLTAEFRKITGRLRRPFIVPI
ncbi:MAG TPA: helix-turn-helix transcriptional regulator [Thermoanaerobaculia bacterium]|nr:helix-turn-helix transcriptional regulator [Thermoanaerobaculia bacterium]